MIIKQSVVDVLMFLFERYLDDEETNETSRVTDKRDSIQLRLEEMGFHNQEINQAFDWLEDLAEVQLVELGLVAHLAPGRQFIVQLPGAR